jgi:hypothetical protein
MSRIQSYGRILDRNVKFRHSGIPGFEARLNSEA